MCGQLQSTLVKADTIGTNKVIERAVTCSSCSCFQQFLFTGNSAPVRENRVSVNSQVSTL